MKRTYKIGLVIGIVLFLCLFVQSDIWAQCPMCRMSAESNMKNGGTDGQGLNAGILYMFLAPYLLVGSIGYWWWRNRKLQAEDLEERGSSI